MTKVWLFNPGHEEALRLPLEQRYTPKREVLQMMQDLAPLMRCLAEGEDLIWRPHASGRGGELLSTRLEPITPEQCPDTLELSPWALEAHCLKATAESLNSLYPTLSISLPNIPADYLALSHRRQAHSLLTHLIGQGLAAPCLLPVWIESAEHADEVAAAIQGYIDRLQLDVPKCRTVFAKRPFTSSGRGVQRIELPIAAAKLHSLTASCLKSGSLSLEPFLQVCDNWAIEYWSDGQGQVDFVALSHFETSAQGGAYTGNILAPQTKLWAELGKAVGSQVLERVVAEHIDWLTRTLGDSYRGYIGIDLLLYEDNDDGVLHLHPAVEINLRTTMGVLAHHIYERLVSPRARGHYRLVYLPSDKERAYYAAQQKQTPTVYTTEGLLLSGHYPLTPLQADTSFYAYLELQSL